MRIAYEAFRIEHLRLGVYFGVAAQRPEANPESESGVRNEQRVHIHQQLAMIVACYRQYW